jgi:hypothetical protein
MQLIFEGHSIVERSFDSVKFVGRYCDEHGRDRYVACHVSREALERLVGEPVLTAETLLGVYRSNSAQINRIASAQYSGGIGRPLVRAQDLLQLGRTAV